MSTSVPSAGLPSVDTTVARNSTQVNLAIAVPPNGFLRVGRVQSMSEDISNNVQQLMELGSQFAVELKKGITTFTFSIAKFYVHTDVFDQLKSGAIFALQIQDVSPNYSQSTAGSGYETSIPTSSMVVLEQFQSCAITSVSRSFTQGQATIAQNATVMTIGQSYGNPD